MSFQVRPAQETDVARMLDWAAAEGWNPGKDDAAAFFAADPQGFFMGFDSGEPVSAISMVKYGAKFAFLGLYIVRSGFRGKGYGKATWDAAMKSVEGVTVGLDGVVAQQPNYRKSGFELAHNTIRYAGNCSRQKLHRPDLVGPTALTLDQIAQFESRLFPVPRLPFLDAWLFGAETRRCLCLVDGGELRGYGVIRACAEGHKIGPLFANDTDAAEALLHGLVAEAGAGHVILDVPQTNPQAIDMAERLGLSPVFETARMYRGPAPVLDFPRMFGITTFELG